MDLYHATCDANKLLKENESDSEIICDDQRAYIHIYSVDLKTQEMITHAEGLTRDEAYNWLCGFNTGILNKND